MGVPQPIYELCLGRSLQGWLLACCTKHAWKHAAQHAADRSDSLVLTCRAACPVCHTAYEQQAVDDPVRRETNPNPKWPVPFEVIEWQPSYTQKVTCSRLESQALLPRQYVSLSPLLPERVPSVRVLAHTWCRLPPNQHFRTSVLGCSTYMEATQECLWRATLLPLCFASLLSHLAAFSARQTSVCSC